MDLAVATVIIVRVFLVVTMLGVGLQLGSGARIGLDRTGRNWLAAMLAVNLAVMPATGVVVCLVLGLRGEVAIGLLACAVAPAGSLAPKLVQLARGDLARGVLATFILASLAALTVPPTLGLAASVTGLAVDPAALDVVALMLSLGLFQLLPMVIGLSAARWRPVLGARLVGPLVLASNVLIVAIVVVALADTIDDVIRIGAAPLVAMTVVALAGQVIGWSIGGPDRAIRRASAVVTAQRSPGLALLVVAGPGHPVATATVVVATLALTVTNVTAALVHSRLHPQRMRSSTPGVAPDAVETTPTTG